MANIGCFTKLAADEPAGYGRKVSSRASEGQPAAGICIPDRGCSKDPLIETRSGRQEQTRPLRLSMRELGASFLLLLLNVNQMQRGMGLIHLIS